MTAIKFSPIDAGMRVSLEGRSYTRPWAFLFPHNFVQSVRSNVIFTRNRFCRLLNLDFSTGGRRGREGGHV